MKKNKIIKNTIIFIIVTILFYIIPYTHDDWGWGSSIGLERLNSSFNDYNGRWAGNILIILLTRNRFVKSIVMSSVVICTLNIIKKIIDDNNKEIVHIIILLFLLIPYRIFAQTLTWTSGFVNYVIPTLTILIYILINNNIFLKKENKISNKYSLLFLLLGFITSLFLENLTIYNFLLALFFLTYEKIFFKKVSLKNIFYCIGALSGTILMFSNSAYRNILNSTDTYRTIEQNNIISESVKNYLEIMYKYIIHQNYILNIILGILIIIIIQNFIKSNKDLKRILKYFLIIPQAIIMLYITYIIISLSMNDVDLFINDNWKVIFEGILGLLFIISITITIFICIKNREKKFKMIFIIASIFTIIGPLLFITPIGPRNFYTTYILFIILTMELFLYIKNYNKIEITRVLIFCVKTISIILLMFYFYIFGYIYKVENERNKYIENNKDYMGALYLPNLPNTQFMQFANPTNINYLRDFKLFYNIETNKVVKFMEYESWLKMIADKN